jgi:acyl carrier protein
MPMSRASIRAAVVDSLAEIVGLPAIQIAEGDHLVNQVGLDSLNAANCLVAVEQRLGARIPEGHEADLADVTTVGDLVDRLLVAFNDSEG